MQLGVNLLVVSMSYASTKHVFELLKMHQWPWLQDVRIKISSWYFISVYQLNERGPRNFAPIKFFYYFLLLVIHDREICERILRDKARNGVHAVCTVQFISKTFHFFAFLDSITLGETIRWLLIGSDSIWMSPLTLHCSSSFPHPRSESYQHGFRNCFSHFYY